MSYIFYKNTNKKKKNNENINFDIEIWEPTLLGIFLKNIPSKKAFLYWWSFKLVSYFIKLYLSISKG